MAFIKSQFSGEGLVQQRLLQRLLRGELLHVEGFQALWQIGAGGLYHLGPTFMAGGCVGVRTRGRRDFGFSSGSITITRRGRERRTQKTFLGFRPICCFTEITDTMSAGI